MDIYLLGRPEFCCSPPVKLQHLVELSWKCSCPRVKFLKNQTGLGRDISTAETSFSSSHSVLFLSVLFPTPFPAAVPLDSDSSGVSILHSMWRTVPSLFLSSGFVVVNFQLVSNYPAHQQCAYRISSRHKETDPPIRNIKALSVLSHRKAICGLFIYSPLFDFSSLMRKKIRALLNTCLGSCNQNEGRVG